MSKFATCFQGKKNIVLGNSGTVQELRFIRCVIIVGIACVIIITNMQESNIQDIDLMIVTSVDENLLVSNTTYSHNWLHNLPLF